MTQPGHATDIYTYRYIGQTLRTTWAEKGERPGDGAYDALSVNLGAASGVFNIPAPFGGKIARIEVQTQTTTGATNKITLAVTNESNSAAAIASAAYDDDPVLTTNVVGVMTLSTTAANLVVDQGDNIEIAYTEAGTIAGGMVTVYFENI